MTTKERKQIERQLSTRQGLAENLRAQRSALESIAHYTAHLSWLKENEAHLRSLIAEILKEEPEQ